MSRAQAPAAYCNREKLFTYFLQWKKTKDDLYLEKIFNEARDVIKALIWKVCNGKLSRLAYDYEDLENEVLTYLWKTVLKKFSPEKTFKFDRTTFYNWFEEGIFLCLLTLLNKHRKREAHTRVDYEKIKDFLSSPMPEVSSFERIDAFFSYLENELWRFSYGERRVLRVIIDTKDYNLLVYYNLFYDRFGYSRPFFGSLKNHLKRVYYKFIKSDII